MYISGTFHIMSEDEIVAFLKKFRPVNVKMMLKDLKCYAFVKFVNPECASQAASKLNKTTLRGRVLVVRQHLAENREKPISTESGWIRRYSLGASHLISVRFWTNNEPALFQARIFRLFKEFNPEYVKLLVRENHSFAFVTMKTAEDAQRAVKKMHGSAFEDQRISCKIYREVKNPVEDPGSITDNFRDQMLKLMKSKPALQETPSTSSDSTAHARHRDDISRPQQSLQMDCLPQASADASSTGLRENKIYMDNLPMDVTMEDLLLLFERYRPVSVRREPYIKIGFGVVEMATSNDVVRAVRKLHGTLFKGFRLHLASMTSSLRLVENVPDSRLNPTDSKAVSGPEHVMVAKNLLLIPVEMRGSFLVAMLRGCFKDLNWLGSLLQTRGKLSLLVTNVYSDSQYFWAVTITEETYYTLSGICKGLVKAEPKLPYIGKKGLARERRCMARCVLTPQEEGTWSRCWVSDVVSDYAVVFFVDFGVTDVLPISSLRNLNSDKHWRTPPMARPFFLVEGSDAVSLFGSVFTGQICGSCCREPHILNFQCDE